ncbi:ABC transporter permease [Clostridium bowmanii]|uniref:ABC transporter permease n=1 Tax=Clostridium bowmanii TaxID=132925 RepID=UPI001C0B3954|nr:ABC transporter permease [Clostridium bowmanii]MBU3190807.1 ABC transporter permease [Clostridium bowmanii]MCA1075289.1 ABC transporter permease [Clostridium bowmanii]
MSYYGEVAHIVFLSLFVSITATLIASMAGTLLAIPLALKDFRIKKYIVRLSETSMIIPPVLMGLVVYLVLSRKGPLGHFELLYTPTAMIIAQGLLVFPIVFGLTVSAIGGRGRAISEAITIGIILLFVAFMVNFILHGLSKIDEK